MNICSNCLKNTCYHSDSERINCLEDLLGKLISTLEDSEIIETKNEKDTNWKTKIVETDTLFAWRCPR